MVVVCYSRRVVACRVSVMALDAVSARSCLRGVGQAPGLPYARQIRLASWLGRIKEVLEAQVRVVSRGWALCGLSRAGQLCSGSIKVVPRFASDCVSRNNSRTTHRCGPPLDPPRRGNQQHSYNKVTHWRLLQPHSTAHT